MALRISRRVCTLGRPRALGAGTKGSMWNHSASDKSVWYALLMLGTLPSHYLRTPFRTVSLDDSVNGHQTWGMSRYLTFCSYSSYPASPFSSIRSSWGILHTSRPSSAEQSRRPHHDPSSSVP